MYAKKEETIYGVLRHPQAANKYKAALFVHLSIKGRRRYKVIFSADVVLTMELGRLVERAS